MTELQCPSLEYVNEMTWAEFQIRSYGWVRADKRESWKLRQVAYFSAISMGVDPKTFKIEKYWQIGNMPIRKEVSKRRKQKMLQAVIQYKIDLEKAKKNG